MGRVMKYRIAGNFRGRKLSRISRIRCHSWLFFPQKKGVAHFGLLRIVSGPWWIHESFLREILHFNDSWKFSPSKVSGYTVYGGRGGGSLTIPRNSVHDEAVDILSFERFSCASPEVVLPTVAYYRNHLDWRKVLYCTCKGSSLFECFL